MAIEQGTETLSVVIEERTWRTEVFTEKGVDPLVRFHRETLRVDDVGNVLARERGVTVERRASEVAAESLVIEGKTYTGAELAAIVAGAADHWRQQDIDAAEGSGS